MEEYAVKMDTKKEVEGYACFSVSATHANSDASSDQGSTAKAAYTLKEESTPSSRAPVVSVRVMVRFECLQRISEVTAAEDKDYSFFDGGCVADRLMLLLYQRIYGGLLTNAGEFALTKRR